MILCINAGLLDTPVAQGPFTLFVPHDAAMAAVSVPELRRLLDPANLEDLRGFMLRHATPGRVPWPELLRAGALTTAGGDRLSVEARDGEVVLGGRATITGFSGDSDLFFYVIDAALLPGG